MGRDMLDFLEENPLYPTRTLRRDKAMLPAERGVYGFFFNAPPGIAPIEGSLRRDGLALLYIGNAGADLSRNGMLRRRLGENHLSGNERQSTVCMTLAALLPDIAGPSVARYGKGRWTFHTSSEGKVRMREWMDQHVSICWIVHNRPADVESELIRHYRTPLNIRFASHPFAAELDALRAARKAAARANVAPRG